MLNFQTIVNDIKNLKIQGAVNVAKWSAKALLLVASKYKSKERKELIHILNKAKTILLKTRPTEPAMRNVLNYILFEIEKEEEIFTAVQKRAIEVKEYFEKSNEKIAVIGEKKIMNNSIVFLVRSPDRRLLHG